MKYNPHIVYLSASSIPTSSASVELPVYYVGIVFYTSTRFQGQEEYSYARQQVDNSNGHEWTLLMLEANQAHKEQVLYDQG